MRLSLFEMDQRHKLEETEKEAEKKGRIDMVVGMLKQDLPKEQIMSVLKLSGLDTESAISCYEEAIEKLK